MRSDERLSKRQGRERAYGDAVSGLLMGLSGTLLLGKRGKREKRGDVLVLCYSVSSYAKSVKKCDPRAL